jgi:hypothetical protein
MSETAWQDVPEPEPPGGANDDRAPRDDDDRRDRREQQSRERQEENKRKAQEKRREKARKFSRCDIVEIVEMTFSEDGAILEIGYLERGSVLAICGAAGIGKSRFVIQLAIMCVPQIRIHTLQNEWDGFMHLDDDTVVAGIEILIDEFKPDVIVWDPLRDFSIGDLNSDADMGATLSKVGELTKRNDATRAGVIIHHSLTGKIGFSKAVGYDRSSFGRNSKVLVSWARAQWNLAPPASEDNAELIIGSGKCNNNEEFVPFGIRLDPETMTYAKDDSIDIEGWRAEMGVSQKVNAKSSLETVVQFVERTKERGIRRPDLLKSLEEQTGSKRTACQKWIKVAVDKEKIVLRENDSKLVMPEYANEEVVDPKAYAVLGWLHDGNKTNEWFRTCRDEMATTRPEFLKFISALKDMGCVEQKDDKTWWKN